jgi:hypothetical protein
MDGHFNLHFMPTRLIFDEYILFLHLPRASHQPSHVVCVKAIRLVLRASERFSAE